MQLQVLCPAICEVCHHLESHSYIALRRTGNKEASPRICCQCGCSLEKFTPITMPSFRFSACHIVTSSCTTDLAELACRALHLLVNHHAPTAGSPSQSQNNRVLSLIQSLTGNHMCIQAHEATPSRLRLGITCGNAALLAQTAPQCAWTDVGSPPISARHHRGSPGCGCHKRCGRRAAGRGRPSR